MIKKEQATSGSIHVAFLERESENSMLAKYTSETLIERIRVSVLVMGISWHQAIAGDLINLKVSFRGKLQYQDGCDGSTFSKID